MQKAPERVTSRADAEALVTGVLATMRDLEAALGEETALVRVGRLRDGLAPEARKGELAAGYMRALEAVKANAIALARFAPDAVEKLKGAHAGFARTVEENRVVLATARAVSEWLVRSLSDEVARASRPQTYAPAAPGRASAEPLVLSRKF